MDSTQIQAWSSWNSTQICYLIVFKQHNHSKTQFHINSRFHTQTIILQAIMHSHNSYTEIMKLYFIN